MIKVHPDDLAAFEEDVELADEVYYAAIQLLTSMGRSHQVNYIIRMHHRGELTFLRFHTTVCDTLDDNQLMQLFLLSVSWTERLRVQERSN